MNRKLQMLLWVLSLWSLFALGLGVRRTVLAAQVAQVTGPLPFTLESALFFRRVEQVVAQGRMPEVDRQCEIPRGLRVRETDTVGAEYLYAAMARWLPSRLTLADRVRWVAAGWFCLGIPLLALWIAGYTGSRRAGFLAAALYAVALASVSRSTGQELLHENVALPLLLASLAAGAWAGRAVTRWGFGLAAAAAATALALALTLWDLMQFYVFIWAVWLFIRLVLGRTPATHRELVPGLLNGLGLLFAGLLNPYLRAHGFAWSPVLALVAGALVVGWLRQRYPFAGRWRWAWAPAALLVPLAAVLLARAYPSAYGHFGELLWAKLRFLNVKPEDPALLTFAQRIMWVPALHSATFSLTFTLFPCIVLLSLLAAVCLAFRKSDPQDFRLAPILVGYLVSLFGFVLFVRLHVFLVVFAVALLGLWMAWALRRGVGTRRAVTAALAAAVLVEAAQVLRQPQAWGARNVYYRELAELTEWLRRNVAPEPVLANFGVSASILEYGQCAILLHPKFESEAIRRRVEEYGEVLFKGSETGFRDWAERGGALFYVHALGEFSSTGISQQMRYFVNAVQPRSDSPAWLFEFAPEQLKLFTKVWGNRKYRVFQIRLRADPTIAADQAEVAESALQRGQLNLAERYAMEALSRDPQQATAQRVLRLVGALRQTGFSGSADEQSK